MSPRYDDAARYNLVNGAVIFGEINFHGFSAILLVPAETFNLMFIRIVFGKDIIS